MVVETTLPGVKQLRDALDAKTKEFKGVVKIGRTHLMDATPHLGTRIFWLCQSQLDHGIAALEFTLKHLSQLALGGTAVGTGINTPKGYAKRVAEFIAEFTRLPFITAHNKLKPLQPTTPS